MKTSLKYSGGKRRKISPVSMVVNVERLFARLSRMSPST